MGVGGVAGVEPPEAGDHPLDPYPGFARSSNAALRDDTIAYWEAFRREEAVKSCMDNDGFEYVPAVAFPNEAMLQVARGLDVDSDQASAAAQWPEERNAAYEASLEPEEVERFNQALFGESAADIAEAARTGFVPAGKGDDFATRGCFGQANSAPSIWDLRHQLSHDLDTMRRDIENSDSMIQVRVAYEGCARELGFVATSPEEIEQAMTTSADPIPGAREVLEKCGGIWSTGYRVADWSASQRFVKEHGTELGAAASTYVDAIDTIRSDQAFLGYMAAQAALGAAEADGHARGD